MNINTNYTKILTDENLMETVQHGNSSYPFQFYYEDLSVFDFNCIEWHWHTELEFIYIESGTVTFWIGEDQFKLSEGDGIFINTKVLHRLYSPSKALIPNFVFMPSFIAACDSFIYQKYILPVISSSLSFLIFHKEVCWQARALTVMQQIISAQDSAASKELITVSLLQNLWQEIFE
ncbi:MAG: cupin domain-containing protein, partial [Lachnospiraceae bacterium]|nr:cupin domain-containing protein [Lachnospiraceae bacterium]